MNLWVNGVFRASRAIEGPIELSDGALMLGGNNFWGEFFDGAIDNVRIYDRALDRVEIQTNMGDTCEVVTV